MKYEHVTPELLEAFNRGELPKGMFNRLILEHLGRTCPTCRKAIVRWKISQGPQLDSLLVAAHGAILSSLVGHEGDLQKRWREARRDLRTLKRLTPEQRRQRIFNARTRMRGVELGELMLKESRSMLPADGEMSALWARLAGFVVWVNQKESVRQQELLSLAAALEANGLRLQDQNQKAAKAFARLRASLDAMQSLDPAVEAEIAGLEASLWKDLRSFHRAHALLAHAADLYRSLEASVQGIRIQVQLAEVERESGHPDMAVDTLTQILPDLSRSGHSRLLLCARHNLAFALCEAGRHDRAALELQVAGPLYNRFPETGIRLRRLWLEAKIANGLGELDAAEEAFEQVASGFLQEGFAYDAAMASLELAAVYLGQGKTESLKRLALQLNEVFRAEGIHREAVAALVLVQQAVQEEHLTQALLNRIQRFLVEARNHPELKLLL